MGQLEKYVVNPVESARWLRALPPSTLGLTSTQFSSRQSPILVVDDDEANLIAMRSILEDLGQPVVCALSGFEALRHLLDQEFAVILLDVFMPGMDGYEAATIIRSRERTRHIPIIFLTAANEDQSHLYKGYTAGAVDYIFKPIEPQILRAKVSVFIELHLKIQEVRHKAELEKRLLAENLEVRRQHTETAQALERSEAQQSLLIESLPISLYVASPEDGFRSRSFVGGNVERLCGLPASKFSRTRKVWLSRIHDDDSPVVHEALESAQKSGQFSAEYRWRCADGTYRWFSDRGTVARSPIDGRLEMFGIWLDISERRTLEQQLAHAQKIEAIGQMTGGIAHDFNNMLSVILGGLQMLEPEDFRAAKARRRVELALQAARSCADLTKRLLSFARRQTLEPVGLNLGQEIGRLIKLIERSITANIGIEVDCPPEIWPVYIDRTQLEAALMNLSINARDAMPEGGTLQISAKNYQVDDDTAARFDIIAGDYVELTIADNGEGMSEDVKSKAFEPFFTTKGIYKGTGLGLSTIYGFIRQSGGAVSIDSALGEGTSVRMLLPRSNAEMSDKAATDFAQGKMYSCSDFTILVVEDDDSVREMAVSMLEEMGYKTLQAATGAEALEQLRSNSSVSLLFSDCVMQGDIDGHAVAEEALKLRPEMPILLTSGYRELVDANSELSGSFRFLSKPYSPEQLRQAVQLVIAAAEMETS